MASKRAGGVIFDHKAWLSEFRSSKNFRELRLEIMQQTLKACESFKYTLEDGSEVVFSNYESVSRDARETMLYTDEEPPGRHVKGDEDSCFKTEVIVVNADCLEEAIRLKNKGFNPAVLNMASPKRPGGGYLSGAGAQEENLFRRTNYVQHLADPEKKFDPTREWKYRIPEFSCIYSKNVFIIRASEAEGYKFLANPVPMSFLALPAYPNPTLTKDKKKLIPLIAENTKRKIRCLLSAGLYYGHDSLVLSALGCGAFRNPASHMAQLFKDVLSEGRFANRYKHISFAILDDHNARGDGNFKPFLEVFADCT